MIKIVEWKAKELRLNNFAGGKKHGKSIMPFYLYYFDPFSIKHHGLNLS